ncbi:hypothetical protein [Luteimonas terricola]|nr:hypothetical protein [Luteimonas terricola]
MAFAVTAQAAPDAGEASGPFLGGFLKETRIVYPLQLGEWEAVGEQLYDAVELGASVRYQSGDSLDRWIDVYFYPVGVVPGSHLQQAALATLQDIESNVGRPGGYVDAELGELRRFQVGRVDDKAEAIPALSADMRLVREEGDYHSAVTLLIDRLYYVKGRYSVAAGAMDRSAVRGALEAFIAELVSGTYIGSTGSCWSPAPVEAPPAGAAVPAESRLSITSEGGNGRLYPGCVGAEPHNPDVPEGHREIRFEYRAPGDVRGDGSRRLLPPRAGLG